MKFLVIDTGGFHVETARRLGRDGNQVWYYCPWHSSYAKFEDYAPGVGVKEITKVMDFGPYIDQTDVIVFTDTGLGGFCDTLRKSGKAVFGAGLGEEMELDRKKSVKIMDEIGLKHPESVTINGIDNALEWLDKNLKVKNETNQNASGKFYVKFDVFRGSSESFPAADIEEVRFMFDGLRPKVGPFAEIMPIQIQRAVEGIECGADLFFDGKEWVMPTMLGFETGNSYVGYITDDMSIYKPDMDKMAAYLRRVQYRGCFSFECIYDGTDCYWIDHTCRFPMPLGLMYCEYVKDWGKTVADIARGNCSNSGLPMGRYLGCMEVHSEEATERWLPLKGGKKTKFIQYMMSGDRSFSVPGIEMLAVVLGEGATMDEVQNDVGKNAEELSIYFASFQKTFVNDIREKYLAPLLGMGFKFGPGVGKIEEQPQPEPKKASESVQSPAQLPEKKPVVVIPEDDVSTERNRFEEQLVESCKVWGDK